MTMYSKNNSKPYLLTLQWDFFTLLELLIVISIIAILLTILLPALQKARQSGMRIQCLNNQKQCGTGLLFYAEDANGMFANNYSDASSFVTWTDFLDQEKYIKDTSKLCPSWSPNVYSSKYLTYGSRYANIPTYGYKMIDNYFIIYPYKYKHPSQYIQLSDTVFCETSNVGKQSYSLHFNALNLAKPHFRHEIMMNSWFLDGHASGITQNTFIKSIHKEQPAVSIFVTDKRLISQKIY